MIKLECKITNKTGSLSGNFKTRPCRGR